MRTNIAIHSFTTAPILAEALAAEIVQSLSDAINKQGRASLVVSGGSTPKQLFTILSKKRIDWEKITITLADERWVETSDPASNEYLVRSLLLQDYASSANFIGLKNIAPTPQIGQKECQAALSGIPRPFNLVLLGMGDDGHTASLFPDAETLSQAVDMQSEYSCRAITPPTAPHGRMTLTLPALLNSDEILIHITGTKKKMVLDNAMEKGPAEDMPIRYILQQQQTPVQIFWAP